MKDKEKKENPVPKKEGTYIGLNLSPGSIKLLKDLQKQLEIKEDFPFHITLVYSRKKITMDLNQRINKTIHALNFHLFDNSKDGGDRALVIKFNCPYCESRFNYASTALGATFDYPKYEPHITLAYNWEGDIPSDELLRDFKINIVSEYSNVLNLDWTDTNVKPKSDEEKDKTKKENLMEKLSKNPAIMATKKK